jgi:hypothetical protein
MEERVVLAWDDPSRWNALYRPPGTRQLVLGFDEVPETYEAGDRFHPVRLPIYCPFRPLGLFLQGVTAESWVRNIRCGNQSQTNDQKLPALWFATHRSFADLKALAANGELEVPAGSVLEMDELVAGNSFSFEVKGPITGACLWGLIYAHDRIPCERVEVRKEGESFEGRILKSTLRGNEVSFEVTAPSEDGVYRLLSDRRESRSPF